MVIFHSYVSLPEGNKNAIDMEITAPRARWDIPVAWFEWKPKPFWETMGKTHEK